MEMLEAGEQSLVSTRSFTLKLTVNRTDGSGSYCVQCRRIVAVLFKCEKCCEDFLTEELLKGHYSLCDMEIPKHLQRKTASCRSDSQSGTESDCLSNEDADLKECKTERKTNKKNFNRNNSEENRRSENAKSVERLSVRSTECENTLYKFCTALTIDLPPRLRESTDVSNVITDSRDVLVTTSDSIGTSKMSPFGSPENQCEDVSQKTSNKYNETGNGSCCTESDNVDEGTSELESTKSDCDISTTVNTTLRQSTRASSNLLKSLLAVQAFTVLSDGGNVKDNISEKATAEIHGENLSVDPKVLTKILNETKKSLPPGLSVQFSNINKTNDPFLFVSKDPKADPCREKSTNSLVCVRRKGGQNKNMQRNFVVEDRFEQMIDSHQHDQSSVKLGRGLRKRVTKVIPDSEMYFGKSKSENCKSVDSHVHLSPQRKSSRQRKVRKPDFKLSQTSLSVDDISAAKKKRSHAYGTNRQHEVEQGSGTVKRVKAQTLGTSPYSDGVKEAVCGEENDKDGGILQKENSKNVKVEELRSLGDCGSESRDERVTDVDTCTENEMEEIVDNGPAEGLAKADGNPIKTRKESVGSTTKKRAKDKTAMKNSNGLKLNLSKEKSNECSESQEKPVVNKVRKKYPEPKRMCEICGKIMAGPRSLKSHLLMHAGIKKFVCEICGECFTVGNGLLIHKRAKHSGEADPKKYMCTYCGRSFLTTGGCKEHIRDVHEATPVHCPVEGCNSVVKNHKCLKIHMRIHNNDRRYECEICESRFLHWGAFHEHQLRHKGEKPSSCPVCQKAFTNDSKVKRHLKVHKRSCEIPMDYVWCKRPKQCTDIDTKGKIVISSGRAIKRTSLPKANMGQINESSIVGHAPGNVSGNISSSNSDNEVLDSDGVDTTYKDSNVKIETGGDIYLGNPGNVEMDSGYNATTSRDGNVIIETGSNISLCIPGVVEVHNSSNVKIENGSNNPGVEMRTVAIDLNINVTSESSSNISLCNPGYVEVHSATSDRQSNSNVTIESSGRSLDKQGSVADGFVKSQSLAAERDLDCTNVAMSNGGNVVSDCGSISNVVICNIGNISMGSLGKDESNPSVDVDNVPSAESVTIISADNDVHVVDSESNLLLDNEGNVYAVEVGGSVSVGTTEMFVI